MALSRPRQRAGFSPVRSPRAAAASSTASIRPRTRVAVSGFVDQIGSRIAKTCTVSTSPTGMLPITG